MEKNKPNQIITALFKEYRLLRTVKDAKKYDYKREETLKKALFDITHVVGAIEVMSKANILKLVKMQSSLRFMAHHSFYIQFAKACEDFLKLPE